MTGDNFLNSSYVQSGKVTWQQDLPLGKATFSELRANNQLYVDKTDLIFDLARSNRAVFLARPRRFGKSLLLSTFSSLFSTGLRDFKGLKLEALWQDPKTYPVISIDCSRIDSFNTVEKFQKSFEDTIKSAVARSGLSLPSLDDAQGITTITRAFESMLTACGKSPVVLIDEYDFPLNSCLNNKELSRQVSQYLEGFYASLKRSFGYLRFLFITGICKYTELSVFSSGNYITDISMDPKFGTLLGYTEDEIRKDFKLYLENAASVLKITVDECIKELKRNYDGFCFDETGSTHVFVPWSTLSFFNAPQRSFKNYWFLSGGQSSVLLSFIKEHSLKRPEEYGRDQCVELLSLDNSHGFDDVTDVILLCQTGYLTIKKIIGTAAVLNYPNDEVAQSMATLYRERIFPRTDASLKVRVAELFAGLNESTPDENTAALPSAFGFNQRQQDESSSEGGAVSSVLIHDADTRAIAVCKCLNAIVGSMDYLGFPIHDEISLRAVIQIYLLGVFQGIGRVDVEKHNAFGRSDVEIDLISQKIVLELKYARSQGEEERLLQQALNQLKARHYGETDVAVALGDKRLTCIAMVYSEEQKQFIRAEILR